MSPGRSAESWFHFKFGQTEMKKEIWRQRARSQNDKMSQSDSYEKVETSPRGEVE